MKKAVTFLSGLLLYVTSAGQPAAGRTLFIIDSIPVLNNIEDWNTIAAEDIADMNIVSSPDSIKLLGWEEVDRITFIFTRSYRNRPDSVKLIPRLKHMASNNGIWTLNDAPYSGHYIDYYINGRIQSEGMMVNGRPEGKITTYFKNGVVKSVSDYKQGKLDGEIREYYKNGGLYLVRGFSNGMSTTQWEEYFINGQKMTERKPKAATPYDTIIIYYSTGRINETRLMRNGVLKDIKRVSNKNYYSYRLHHSMRSGDLKAANQNFFRLWLMDSTSAAIHLTEGNLLSMEGRFDDAIIQYDLALSIEPLMSEALLQRALARARKYKMKNNHLPVKIAAHIFVDQQDLQKMPTTELLQICKDFVQADDLDPTDYSFKQGVGPALVNYCSKRLTQ